MPKSKEMRRLLASFVILFTVFLLVEYLILEAGFLSISEKITDQNRAMVGAMLNSHPELEEEVIQIVTKEVPENLVQIGRDALEKYNYNEFISHRNQIALAEAAFNLRSQMLILLLVILFFGLVLFIWTYRSIRKKIERLYLASEKVINGDFSVALVEEGEGSLSVLNHQFNKMSQIIQNNYALLNREKSFLKDAISDISHQLKTPLAAALMFNELMLDDEDMDPATRRDFLEKSKLQYERMEWLVVNLLKIARIEAGAIDFKRELMPFMSVVDAAIRGVESRLMEASQTIDVRGDTKAQFVGDAKWTEEAITNILKNATEHSPEGATITIILKEDPTVRSISIRNPGSHIQEEDTSRIFRRFYKSGEKSDSIGIGLNLTKSIVEGQGGMISATNVEGGVEFTIAFMKLDSKGLDPDREAYIRDMNTAVRRKSWK
ncbi:MAG: HAMP domain-containing sensor histidine kinase [Tissierellia bacterium]|nr:HAMP domain-containing sensor histidine kinase [Tissierellia bacterium]